MPVGSLAVDASPRDMSEQSEFPPSTLRCGSARKFMVSCLPCFTMPGRGLVATRARASSF